MLRPSILNNCIRVGEYVLLKCYYKKLSRKYFKLLGLRVPQVFLLT